MDRCLVVSHDAGGAEVLSSWLVHHPGPHYALVLEGPARAVFARKGVAYPELSRDRMLAGEVAPDRVLTGTSWGADLEKRAVRHFRARGVFTATWLDHWTDFAARFSLEGRVELPDEIWVGDAHAERLARALPGACVVRATNHYLEDVAADIRARTAANMHHGPGIRVLYVTEPTAAVAQKKYGDPRRLGYTELEALENYLAAIASISCERITEVRIRPHPAEEPGKYDRLVRASTIPAHVSRDPSLAADVAWADRVVGCDSMAMVVALTAGKPVQCALPAGVPGPSLPFPEIVRLWA